MFGRRSGEGRSTPPDVRADKPPHIEPKPRYGIAVLPEAALGSAAFALRQQADARRGEVIAGGPDAVQKRTREVEVMLAEADRLEQLAHDIRNGDVRAMRETQKYFREQRTDLDQDHRRMTEELRQVRAQNGPEYQRYKNWTAVQDQARSLATTDKQRPDPLEAQVLKDLAVLINGTRYGRLVSDAEKLENKIGHCDALIANLNQRLE